MLSLSITSIFIGRTTLELEAGDGSVKKRLHMYNKWETASSIEIHEGPLKA